METMVECTRDLEGETIGDTYEGIEQLIASSWNYLECGREDLAGAVLRQAWREFLPFQDILHTYLGSDELEQRLIAALSLLDNPFALAMEQEPRKTEMPRVLTGSIAA